MTGLVAPKSFVSVFSEDFVEYVERDPVGHVLDPRQWVDVGNVDMPQVVPRPLEQGEAGPELGEIVPNQLVLIVQNHVIVHHREQGSL